MLEWIVMFFVPALFAFGGSHDMLTMTIPNRLSLVLVATFFPATLLAGLPLETVAMHAAAGLAVLVIGLGCFSQGWIGAGDVKFASAVALWVGWTHLLPYAFLFALLGAGLSVLLVVARAKPLPLALYRAPWVVRLHDRSSGVPYGIALALAALMIFPQTVWGGFFLAG